MFTSKLQFLVVFGSMLGAYKPTRVFINQLWIPIRCYSWPARGVMFHIWILRQFKDSYSAGAMFRIRIDKF